MGDQTRRVRRTQIQTTRSHKSGVGRDAWGASVLEWSLQAEWRVVGWATPQAWHPVERLECGQERGKWAVAVGPLGNIPQGPAQAGPSTPWNGGYEFKLRHQVAWVGSWLHCSLVVWPQASYITSRCLGVCIWIVGIITVPCRRAAGRMSTEVQHLAQGCVQSNSSS